MMSSRLTIGKIRAPARLFGRRQQQQQQQCSSRSRGRSTSSSLFWVATTTTLSYTSYATQCDPSNRIKRPPTFGASIRDYSTTKLPEVNLEDRSNCPLCDKYSKGPCGPLFQTWLQCTDDHPGKEQGQDWHLTKCAAQAQALSDCLDKHETFYEKPFETITAVEEEEQQDLQQAWERLVKEDLPSIPRHPWPQEHKPTLEFRPHDRTATLLVSLEEIHHRSLLLVFLQDKHNDTLLSAGSLQDLFRYTREGQPVGVLQCTLPADTTQIVVSALYEPQEESSDDNKPIIYTFEAHVPPADKV